MKLSHLHSITYSLLSMLFLCLRYIAMPVPMIATSKMTPMMAPMMVPVVGPFPGRRLTGKRIMEKNQFKESLDKKGIHRFSSW